MKNQIEYVVMVRSGEGEWHKVQGFWAKSLARRLVIHYKLKGVRAYVFEVEHTH